MNNFSAEYKKRINTIDEYMKKGLCPELSSFGSMLGLMPAWTGKY